MRIRAITFEDVMEECNIEDPAEFRRLLRANRLHMVSEREPIERNLANKIVRRLQGRNIDWYKYKQEERDRLGGGPLERRESGQAKDQVDRWFQTVALEKDIESLEHDCLLGLVCDGGFLEGPGHSSFALKLEPAGNIFIGDRGSGKSTILNLLSLLATSVSEETNVLVAKLTNLLKTEQETIADVSRRVRKVLGEYEVHSLGCFFTTEGRIRCYYVDLRDNLFDIVERRDNHWRSVTDAHNEIGPPMLVLQQGEVTSIADRRHKFYLSNILDSLYPSLYERRTKLARNVKKLATQIDYYERNYDLLDSQPAYFFIEGRELELNGLRNDLARSDAEGVCNRVVQDVGGYVSWYNAVEHRSLPQSIDDLFREGIDEAWIRLYVGGIIGFLSRSVRFVEQRGRHDIGKQDERAILDAGQAIADSLEQRQRLFRSWLSIYSRKRLVLDDALLSLVGTYRDLLQQRVTLIEYQEDKCRVVTETLNRGALEVRVSTIGAGEIIDGHSKDITRLAEVERAYRELMQAEPQMELDQLYALMDTYDGTVEWFFDSLDTLHREAMESQPSFLFMPIDVELRQGSTYRGFHQLSFGQKSGIILKMVLDTTSKHVIVIDQPEDNLDASSIVHMLAPTISNLQKDRQVIVATHDSNLVMGLRASNLVLLESLGEKGKIRLQGPLHRQDVVRGMLDVLEGGVSSFDMKMSVYEDFVSHVQGLIEDADINLIESSFRRRTIDGLRNFLQPVVSDRAILGFLRHELKQGDPARIRRDIMHTKEKLKESGEAAEVTVSEITERVDLLCHRLDGHIERLQRAIEEIRLMDTEANPHRVNLYDVLQEVRRGYSGISDRRDINIHVDNRLQDQSVFADENHLRLVFNNLLSNSLRATERRAVDAWQRGETDLSEEVRIEFSEISPAGLAILFSDNGCGIRPDIREKLYIERCTDQKGRDHGLGGVIIRKLLDLNGGSIQVLCSNCSGEDIGTVQSIVLSRRKTEEAT